jgi:DNA-binding PadR family transcriptional regulator
MFLDISVRYIGTVYGRRPAAIGQPNPQGTGSMLELAILGLLTDQPLHGYELKKRLGESLGVLWGVSYGSLYPALRRLEKSGAIEEADPAAIVPAGAPVPSTGSLTGDLAVARNRLRGLATPGRRTRKAYRITTKGVALFEHLLHEDIGDDDRGFALRLSFFRHLSVGERLSLLERRRSELSVRLDKARRGRAPDGLDRYTRSLVEHRTRSIAHDLEWVDELIAAETSSAHEEGATA